MSSQPAQQVPYSAQQPWDAHTDIPVGEILRRTRIHFGQSLEYVETVLRIRASQLEALETGEIDKLPGRVYAIGFVRTYSEYLGLDGEKMVYLFKVQSVGTGNKPELHFPASASESKLPGMPVLAGSFAAIVVLVTLLALFDGKGKTADEIPSVAVATAKTALLSTETYGPLPEKIAGSGSENPDTPAVLLKIKDSAWIEIRDKNNKVLISRTLKAGDSYTVPDGSDYTLSTGNIAAVQFIVGGEKLPLLGNRGDIRRGLFLTPENLKKAASSLPVPKQEAAPATPPETQPKEEQAEADLPAAELPQKPAAAAAPARRNQPAPKQGYQRHNQIWNYNQ